MDLDTRLICRDHELEPSLTLGSVPGTVVAMVEPGGRGDHSTASGDTFRSLRVRNFRLFFLGQSVSQVGNWLTIVAQVLLVLKLTDSGVAVGVLAAFQYVPVLALGAWAGVVADRFDKRRLLIAVQSTGMVQSFALAAIAAAERPSVWLIYIVAAIGGVATAFDNPTRRSLVVEMVPERDMANAASLNTAMMTGSRIFGPALAGLLITTVGFAWCFTIDAISYGAVLLGLWRMDPEAIRRSPVVARAKGQVREGLRYARSEPEIWVTLVMMLLIGTFTFNFNTVLPLLVKRSFGRSDTAFTIVMSITSVGSVIGALLTARRHVVRLEQVVSGALLFGVMMTALAAAPSFALALPIGVGVGLGSTTFMARATALVQQRADPVMRGRVLAMQSLVFLGTTPVGAPIVGSVSEAFGARYGVLIGAAAALIAAAWGWSAAARITAGAATSPG